MNSPICGSAIEIDDLLILNLIFNFGTLGLCLASYRAAGATSKLVVFHDRVFVPQGVRSNDSSCNP